MIGSLLRLAYQTHMLSFIPGMMNTIVSNVPGPAGAICTSPAPNSRESSPRACSSTAWGSTSPCSRFGDRVDFGLHVDPDLIEDPWEIADALPVELATLMERGGLGDPRQVVDPFGVGVDDGPDAATTLDDEQPERRPA